MMKKRTFRSFAAKTMAVALLLSFSTTPAFAAERTAEDSTQEIPYAMQPHDIGRGNLILNEMSCPNSCMGHIVSGVTSQNRIIVSGGKHDITLDNINISVDKAIELSGNASISLTFVSDNNLAKELTYGVFAPENTSVTFTQYSSGKLYTSAIGGSIAYNKGGAIVIDGGEIHATSKETAIGSPGGSVTINGGKVYAQSTSGSWNGAPGIGGSYTRFAKSGGTDVTINGGYVEARGGVGGAGIGGGHLTDAGDITIRGGVVYAYGGGSPSGYGGAAGIGGGYSGSAHNITISGGKITAYGDASIGGGGGYRGYASGSCGQVRISGGTIEASNIGSGKYGGGVDSGGSIYISGGSVKATEMAFEPMSAWYGPAVPATITNVPGVDKVSVNDGYGYMSFNVSENHDSDSSLYLYLCVQSNYQIMASQKNGGVVFFTATWNGNGFDVVRQ